MTARRKNPALVEAGSFRESTQTGIALARSCSAEMQNSSSEILEVKEARDARALVQSNPGPMGYPSDRSNVDEAHDMSCLIAPT